MHCHTAAAPLSAQMFSVRCAMLWLKLLECAQLATRRRHQGGTGGVGCGWRAGRRVRRQRAHGRQQRAPCGCSQPARARGALRSCDGARPALRRMITKGEAYRETYREAYRAFGFVSLTRGAGEWCACGRCFCCNAHANRQGARQRHGGSRGHHHGGGGPAAQMEEIEFSVHFGTLPGFVLF